MKYWESHGCGLDHGLGYLVQAIDGLDRTNPDHWNLLGKPHVGVLGEILGYYVSAEERDKAWEQFLRQAFWETTGGGCCG